MYRQFTPESFDDCVIGSFPAVTKKETKPVRRHWLFPNDDDVTLLLEGARDLLRNGFVQSHLALTAQGTHTNPMNSTAKLFCAIGAMERANHDLPAPWLLGRMYRRFRYDLALYALFEEVKHWLPPTHIMHGPSMKPATIMYWNDTTDKATVIAGFNRTIEKARM